MDKKKIDKLLVNISYGNNDSFIELYQGTKNGVFSFLYSYLKQYEDTEDAMQSVYLKIKTSINQYRHGTDGRAWILQIAKNIAINEINKKKRIIYTDKIEVKCESKLSNSITDIMNQILSSEEIYIINLHVLWGYKHKEIAKQMNCPTGTITSKYKRSIEKLKKALKENVK